MNQETIRILFSLLRSAICGTEISDKDRKLLTHQVCSDLFSVSQQHDIAHLIGFAINKDKVEISTEYRQAFTKKMMQAIYRYERLNCEFEQICKALEEARVPFMPLKGSILRNFYPEAWMRTSCDTDILIHNEDIEKAAGYLVEHCQYRCENQGSHDVSMFSPTGNHLELHFDLVEEGRANSSSKILQRVWDTAILKQGTNYQYEMPDEMFYFYHIAHMAKHFMIGGCGIRPFLDIWILKHKMPHNPDKRKALIDAGGILAFAVQAEMLSEIWLGDAEYTNTTSQMESYIINGGVYGTMSNRISVEQITRGGKANYVLSRLWLPYNVLKFQYPSLDGNPALLPLYEIRRWCKLLVGGRAKRSMNELKFNSSIPQDKQELIKGMLSNLGLSDKC